MQQNVWGAPAPPVVPQPRTRSYASLADRFGGLLLDVLILYVAQIPVAIVFYGLSWLLGTVIGTSELCRQYDPSRFDSVRSQYEACLESATWWFIGLLALQVVANLCVWWRLIPGRMVRRGASVGMGIAGLKIEEADSDLSIGSLRALARAVLAGILPLAFSLVPLLIAILMLGSGVSLTDGDEISGALSAGVIAMLVIAAVAYVLPWCWAIFDRRKQTLYDKFAGTVVTGPPGPIEPWAVASLVCGLLAIVVWPFGPVAIVFGHLGIRDMNGTRGQFKGRGAARAGQVLGWAATLVMAGFLLVSLVATIADRGAEDAACRVSATSLQSAASTFRQEYGRYPESDAAAIFGGHLSRENAHYELTIRNGGLHLERQDPDCPSWPF